MQTGDYEFEARCPDCQRVTSIEATIETVLTRRETRGDKLALAMVAKAIDHDCSVEQLTVDVSTGVIA